MHLLYNIFKGSYVGERAIVHSKFILLSILEKKSASLQKDQMDNISKMLAFDPIKNVAKVMRFFDVSSKDVKAKFESDQLQVKIEGLKDLSIIFGNTKTYKEQLQLFANKAQPIIKVLLSDVAYFKKNKDQPLFGELLVQLKDFLLNVICDTRYRIQMEDDPFSGSSPQEYLLEYQGENLTSMEGMFATIASITNFLM